MTDGFIKRQKDQAKLAKDFMAVLKKGNASEMMHEAPEEYLAGQAAARAEGLLGVNVAHNKGSIRVSVMNPPAEARQYSDADLKLMVQYPKSVTDRFFKDSRGDANFIIAKRTPEEQIDIRSAALLHNTLSTGVVKHRTEVVDAAVPDEARIAVGTLAAVAGIDPSTRITPSQYQFLLAAKTQIDATKTPAERAEDHAVDVRRMADLARKQADDLKGNK